MRILIIQDHLRIGGTERQSLYLLKAFPQHGHETQLLVFRPGGHLSIEARQTNAPVTVLQPFQSGLSFWAPGITRAIQKIDPEVILCMGRSANCYAGYLQKRFKNRTVVGTVRTGKSLFPLHQWSLHVVRGVLVNSNWWKRRFLETSFPEERIHVVHNSLLLNRPEEERLSARDILRAEEKVAPDTCVFLNVSSFRPGKRHMELLKIAKTLNEAGRTSWRLWLVGDGRELKRCRRWAAQNGLETQVRFFHYQEDPFRYYAAADVAVSVSREDSLPNFLIEAQSLGMPLIAYDCKGVEETCLPGKTGLILRAGDDQAFLESMADLMADASKRQSLGSGAPEFIRSRFSAEPQAQAMLHFFEHLKALTKERA